MILPFPKKYKYIVLNDIYSIRSEIKAITKTPWYDIAVNLRGQILDDNSFELRSKVAFGIFSMVAPTSIRGQLIADGNTTTIQAEYSGDGLFVSLFFIGVIVALFRIVVGFASYSLDDWIITAGILLLSIAVAWFNNFCVWRLKNRFEKIMMVQPEIENESNNSYN